MSEWLIKYIEKKNEVQKDHFPLPTNNIYDIYFDDDLSELFSFLTEASLSASNIYRGISHNEYGIKSSQRLFRETLKYEDWSVNEEIGEILDEFENALNHLRTDPVSFTKLELLEYARHYGVPTPIIDFSRSPFVALFFAFCEPRKNEIYSVNREEKYALLNIIDQGELAIGYLRKIKKDDYGLGCVSRNKFDGYDESFCTEKFEANILQIIKEPSVFNTRMKNQQGLFLYDTLNYGEPYIWGDSFEDMILKLPNYSTAYPDKIISDEEIKVIQPIMIKVHINIKLTSDILTMLDKMNINAFTIYPDDTGAAMHAKLTHYYTSGRQTKKKKKEVKPPLLQSFNA